MNEPRNELLILAANDYAWSADRIAAYQDDGGTPPPLLVRLHTLAFLVTKQHVAAPADGSVKVEFDAIHAELQKTREILGAIGDEWPSAAACRMERENERLRVGVREAASMLFGFIGDPSAAAAVRGSLLNAPGSAIRVATAGDVHTQTADGAGPGSAAPAFGSVIGPVDRPPVDNGNPRVVTEPTPVPGGREIVKLAHGLVIANGKPREEFRRVLFSEVKQGFWTVQTIDNQGKLGPETGTREGIWFTDAWTIVTEPVFIDGVRPLRWSEKPANDGKVDAAPVKQPGLLDVGPATAAPVASAKIKIGDWTPTDEQIAGHVKTLSEAMVKAKVETSVTVESVKALVARFKSEKAATEATNPGLSFYHWSCKILKGG